MSDNFDKVKEILKLHLGLKDEEITPEADLVNDLGADSLDTVELIMQLEEEFEITIPDEDAEQIKTVEDVLNYIEAMA